MTSRHPLLDLAVSVATDESLGNQGINRLFAFREGKMMLLDSGEQGKAPDWTTDTDEAIADEDHTLKMLYLAIEHIGQLENQVGQLLESNPEQMTRLTNEREDAFNASLKAFRFGEGVTLMAVGGAPLDKQKDEWILDLTLEEAGRVFDASYHVTFQVGSATILRAEAKEKGTNRSFGQLS